MIPKGCPMLKMNDTILFIDSGYLSFISKYFGKGKPLRYKIEDFAENICKVKNLNCKEIYFYIAPPYQSPKPTEAENNRRASYDRFIEKLRNVRPPVRTREGRCQKTNTSFQQKGVDTLMTMDLLKVAQKQEVKTIILITSDTDFVPIIEDIKKVHGIKVILAYFTDRKRKSAFSLSNHLWKVCDEKIFIKKEYFS